jgi:formate dehydrogenase subunit delta
MSGETQARLIYMANQIGRNFAALGHDNAVAATLDHVVKFWDPRMKAQIVALATEEADRFEPIAALAVAQLRIGIEPAPQTRATKFADVDEAGGSDAG